MGSFGHALPVQDERPFCVQRHIAILRPNGACNPDYLLLFLRSSLAFEQAKAAATGIAQPTVGLRHLRDFFVPLPPLTEQERIVAKVDQFMALCDELEAKQAKKRETGERLTKAALAALTSAETPEEFRAAWTRVAESVHLLFDHGEDIGVLRRTVVSLAVRGRIDGYRTSPSEEPAGVFLLRFHGGPVHRPDPVAAGLKGVVLPENWCWARFTEVASIESNLVAPEKYPHLPHVAPDNIEKATGRLLECRTVREDGVISGKHHFFPGQVLYSKIRPNLSKVIVVDFEGLCSADMYPLGSRIDARYLQIFLLSDLFLQQVVRDENRIAMPKVNQQQLSATVVALPPLGVQKRIVAKVDQLTALCDELEARLTARDQKAEQLGEALVVSASQCPAP